MLNLVHRVSRTVVAVVIRTVVVVAVVVVVVDIFVVAVDQHSIVLNCFDSD